MKLLDYAVEVTADIENIKFPDAGVHGNLKVIMEPPINRRKMFRFQCKQDIWDIISMLQTRFHAHMIRKIPRIFLAKKGVTKNSVNSVILVIIWSLISRCFGGTCIRVLLLVKLFPLMWVFSINLDANLDVIFGNIQTFFSHSSVS